jgi:hypothetical protein
VNAATALKETSASMEKIASRFYYADTFKGPWFCRARIELISPYSPITDGALKDRIILHPI